MTTAANPLTINDWTGWHPRWPSVCHNLAWPIYLRFFALAGAGAVNLCVGPIWISELNRTEPVGGPPNGSSHQRRRVYVDLCDGAAGPATRKHQA
jgi:hypothetical protein